MKRGAYIDFDLETFSLEIKTNSTLGSDDLIKVWFYSSTKENAGGLRVYFNVTAKHLIGWCKSRTEFQTSLPEETDKIWKITVTRNTGVNLKVQCNGMEVIKSQFSSSLCSYSRQGKTWDRYWNKEIKKIRFLNDDTASDFYRSGKPIC
jgi:hypothetical protein